MLDNSWQVCDFPMALHNGPRISPKEPFQYKDQVMPPGFPVSLDAVHMHHTEAIFPNSHKFSLERWLDENRKDTDSKTEKRPDRYMVAFSRGTRQCIGINLALAEMYLMLSMMFRRYDMELNETDVDSVKIYAEYFLPAVKPGKEGIKVLVRKSEI
jgi:cytochrome P450